MHVDDGRDEAANGNGLLDPSNDVVTCAPCVVAQVMVEADFRHVAFFQEADCLVWPPHTNPTRRRLALVVQENFHPVTIACERDGVAVLDRAGACSWTLGVVCYDSTMSLPWYVPTAALDHASSRFATWHEIFGDAPIPLLDRYFFDSRPDTVYFEGSGHQKSYVVNTSRLDAHTLDALVNWEAKVTRLPPDTIRSAFEFGHFALRASDVTFLRQS